MKTNLLRLITLSPLVLAPQLFAAQPEYTARERGPHSVVWEPIGSVGEASGKGSGGYVQLETGLNRYSEAEGRWVPAEATIELEGGKAFVRKTFYKAEWSGLDNPRGVLSVTLPDGRNIRLQPRGIAITDSNTGQSAWVSEVNENSVGEVIGNDVILFKDAFNMGDLRFNISKRGIESDVLLATQLPDPASFGIDVEAARAEIWTEVLEAPEPTRKPVPGVEQGLVKDEHIDFGSMLFGPSIVFFDAEGNRSFSPMEGGKALRAAKQWFQAEGRTFLVESLPFSDLQQLLRRLPKAAAANLRIPPANTALGDKGMRKLPQSFAQDSPRKAIRQVAELKRGIKTTPTRDRVVWDYDLVGSGGDFQFKSDTTYYVSGASDFSNVILEGGSVIKYAPRGGGAVPRVLVHGNIDCQTSLYKQAVFTAKDDDTSGAIISGSSGAPSGEYAYHGLVFNDAGANVYLHDLRISYAFLGCSFYFRATNTIQSAVFTHCTYAVDPYTTTLHLRNVLVDECGTAIPASSATVTVQHMTAASCTNLLLNNGSATFNLVNCLYANTTDNTGSTTGYSGSNNGSGSVTAVGAGLSYYGSGTTGTSSIDSSLAADLQTRTTYPPTILATPILTPTTLTPVVQRGYTGSPVRGYFYPPIDYALSNVVVTNTTVVLTNGVVVTAAGSTGFLLQDGAHIKSSGSPTAPNRFVRYNMVQEGITLWGTGTGAASFFSITNSPGSSPSIDLTFTEILTPAAEVARTAILANNNSIIDSFSLRHCLVWNGSLDIAALSNQSSIMTFGFTNTFFWRPDFRLSQGCTNDTTPFYLQLWNNTFIVGTVKLTNASPASTTSANGRCTITCSRFADFPPRGTPTSQTVITATWQRQR